jgi:hypothetical protein
VIIIVFSANIFQPFSNKMIDTMPLTEIDSLFYLIKIAVLQDSETLTEVKYEKRTELWVENGMYLGYSYSQKK